MSTHFLNLCSRIAPTSPIITNMICDTLDRRLAGLAKRFGLRYSRYADDITFSSMHHVYQKDGEFRKELRRIISDQHFTINDDKTRLQKKGARQEVTGIIVSDILNVTQKYVRDIRNVLYIWDRYGYASAMAKFVPKYKNEKGHVKKGNPNLVNVIDGKLMYLKMVKGEEDSVYQRLHNKFVKLVDMMNEKSVTTAQNVHTWGRGYRKIREGFLKSGLPVPTVMSHCGGTLVSFQRGYDVVSGGKNITSGGNFGGSLAVVKLTDKQKEICKTLKANPKMTVSQLAEVLAVAKRTLERELANLQKMDVLVREGNTSAGHWVSLIN